MVVNDQNIGIHGAVSGAINKTVIIELAVFAQAVLGSGCDFTLHNAVVQFIAEFHQVA
jgi:hypothetical protein